MSKNNDMLKDIERREYNSQMAKSILGINSSYTPVYTGWKKFKADLVRVSDTNTFDAY